VKDITKDYLLNEYNRLENLIIFESDMGGRSNILVSVISGLSIFIIKEILDHPLHCTSLPAIVLLITFWIILYRIFIRLIQAKIQRGSYDNMRKYIDKQFCCYEDLRDYFKRKEDQRRPLKVMAKYFIPRKLLIDRVDLVQPLEALVQFIVALYFSIIVYVFLFVLREIHFFAYSTCTGFCLHLILTIIYYVLAVLVLAFENNKRKKIEYKCWCCLYLLVCKVSIVPLILCILSVFPTSEILFKDIGDQFILSISVFSFFLIKVIMDIIKDNLEKYQKKWIF